MFCTQCGNKLGSGDRFCGTCGAGTTGNRPAREGAPTGGKSSWHDSVRYLDIIKEDDVAHTFDLARQEGISTVSADEFTAFLAPLMPVKGMGKGTFRAAESLGFKMYEKIGLIRKIADNRDYNSPVGKVIAAAACAMASNRQEVIEVSQQEAGCTITVRVPPGLTSGAKHLKVAVERTPDGARANAYLQAPLLNWSKGNSRSVLANFHKDISRFLALIG